MTRNAVATPHTLSALAAKRLLVEGGNAVDAALAAVAAQGVVAPETCGVGGDLFALVHQPGWDRPRALNASGRAGSGASADRIRARGATSVPRDHPMAVTVPGCIDGLVELSEELGTIGLNDLLAPAIELARSGFEASHELARDFDLLQDVYGDNPAVSDMYPNGRPVTQGQTIQRLALAETLEAVAADGRDGFYLGRAGEDIVESTRGIITTQDLGRCHAEWIDPIAVEVAQQVAWTIPPNSQGYLGPGSLAIFEMLDAPTDPTDPLWWHLLIESYRCLAWERDDVVADPEHAPLPTELLTDHKRLERAAQSVSRERAGMWPERVGSLGGTAFLCVADSNGMAVSMIQSNYHGTGSPFGASRSGFLLHDRGAAFSLTKGHPNAVAPGKRPLHTLSPTLWTSGNETSWLLGTRGGAAQPQLVAQIAARVILGDQDLEEALAAPRWTVSDFGPGSPPALRVEPGISETALEDLRGRGHTVTVLDDRQSGWGPVSVIDLSGDATRSAADPRVATSHSLVW